MDDYTGTGMHEFNLASRKAEEAAWRRFQATAWLESLVGPLGISTQPSEREFISCLRNGLILCNAINKIQPGAVLKVVDTHSPLQSLSRESQPLPAYQYFENVRNFLFAAEELKLPAFEASDLERDNLEAGSVGKVVDCVLALKSYHEWKQMSGQNGFFKHARSPMVLHSTGRVHSQAPAGAVHSEPCRRLDMSAACERQLPVEDIIVKALTEHMVNTKENIDENLIASFHTGDLDPVKLFSRIMTSCLDEELPSKQPELKLVFKDLLRDGRNSPTHSMHNSKCCRSCSKTGNCRHWRLFQMQKKELSDLKAMLSNTRREFKDLESQFENDLKQLGTQVQEMSNAALGYQKVVKENRTLHNMVQDLKGNIRVHCRVRPAFSTEAKNVINYIGDDGSLVILDPLKPQKEGRKIFQFNRVFGPSATQDEVFNDILPLIKSVMDGYNVCIFAYGQTGSGKTHTMYGPSGGLPKDMGINYLAVSDLFEMSNRRGDIIVYDIHVQMVEIYNEQVRDLLAEVSSTTSLEIRSCTNDDGSSLPDSTMHSVKSSSDVFNLMKLGEVNRVVCSTAINNRSSRSHSVLTVHVHGKDTSGSIIRSCLHLVDLAGSERVDKSEVSEDRLKEAQYINKSLSCLGDVIAALAQKNSHIPYRNSKLTLLLQDSLGGHAKTLLFAHVSPEGDSFGETISTLKFAQKVSTVELGAARMNKENSEVMELKEQIESLKKALANKEAKNVNPNKVKEPRSPFDNPRTTIERTPPRPRRLSIENCGGMKPKAMTERTTPRSRRLSIENSSTMKSEKANKVKEGRSPFENPRTTIEQTPRPRRLSIENCGSSMKPKAMTERTTPRSLRLSIENSSTMKSEKAKNFADSKGSKTPAVPTRARRLSLEGPKYGKKDLMHIKPENVSNPLLFDVLSTQNHNQFQDAVAVSKSYKHFSNGGSTTETHDYKALRSHPSSAYKSRAVKTESGVKMPPLQLPKTPASTLSARNELTISTDSQPRSIMSSAKGKGSQIRRTLQSIGKLINGSEKKNQQNLMDARSPINSAVDDGKSPLTANARALRRRSLTGVQPLVPDKSRRSSFGGDTTDSNTNRTPPPVHPSTKTAKRWL